ncbi:MAG: hypothetical protein HC879_22840 [Leptolyngbyaceae cyanobacterium SL_5_9]|nr:hypothetical protein [Leptolyngbyaceae cyanobacterium SM1_4_3]NJN60111.1 hypothetical protein [Leptolyngbyaceae cyanobacterium SL_5_9]
MQRTIELPDDLAQRLDHYLREHPDETLFSLVMDTLEMRLHPRDLSELLVLSGVVKKSPVTCSQYNRDTHN